MAKRGLFKSITGHTANRVGRMSSERRTSWSKGRMWSNIIAKFRKKK